MRSIILTSIVAFVFSSCNQGTPAAETKKDSTAETKPAVKISYPYTANYSSDFEIGKPENAKAILDLWKAYEVDKFDEVKNLFADSVTIQFENFTFHGSRDSTVKEAKASRGQFTSCVDSLDAWVSLHSKDKNEDWVSVWGREYTTNKKGKKDTADLHEIWQLKNGKVSFMSQYRAHRKW